MPGKAKKVIATGQAKTILAAVRPRDPVGKTRRRLAAELLTELVEVEKKIKEITKELKAMVMARGSSLMELPGVGPVVAARVLADTGDVARFADRNRFASWTGPRRSRPPLERSSATGSPGPGTGGQNHMIHVAAAAQVRLETDGRAYYLRKIAAGKTRREAMRCLKRRFAGGGRTRKPNGRSST